MLVAKLPKTLVPETSETDGLSGKEAERRLQSIGPNAMPLIVGRTLAASIVLALILDFVKIPVLARLRIA
jgi:hypothetical protein